MKIGLYKLKRPKHSQKGWFFIIDTSIQMGPQKCVAVLGIKKLDINQNFCPSLAEVEPLIVKPLCNCPGEVINEILEEAVTIAGVPLAIISDEGAELKKGVRIFSQNHPSIIHLFDISHKINGLLKEELNNDKIWLAFKTSATSAIQHLKLSSIAYLSPPRQRTKDRMHSSFPLIQWGLRTLNFLNSKNVLTLEEKKKMEWLNNYKYVLPYYQFLMEVSKMVMDLVRDNGYYFGVADEFMKQSKFLCRDQKSIHFQDKIKAILQKEEQKMPRNIHYPGSTEIIESLFGKFKAKEGNHASSGLTSLVLGMPALVGEITEDVIENALKKISTLDVKNWINENMGETFLSKRRKALKVNRNLDLDICDLSV